MAHTMTIGQLARQAAINPRTLRYYERIALLSPSGRTEAGYRLYTQQDAERLAFIRRVQSLGLSFIRRVQSLGLSLTEIADIIAVREGGSPPCRHVRALAVANCDHPSVSPRVIVCHAGKPEGAAPRSP